MGEYYQRDRETMPREQMREYQGKTLAAQVKRVYDNVPYYRAAMDKKGVAPGDIKSVDDLKLLPFVEKDDLREAYPHGLRGAPLEDCVRIHSTSGTTGKRVVAFYTQEDINLWYDCCARSITAAGGTKADVVQVAYGYGLFTGGAGLDGGSHKVGALTLPMSSGNTERQIQFMTDLGATILCCTPSYAAFLAETVHEMGALGHIRLKAGIFGAEAWSEEMRRHIEERFSAPGRAFKAYDIYGLTEITGPGVSFECGDQSGMHINEDHFIAEIIDPNTGEVLPDGTKGELVFSSITKRGFPLLRYRTRDICVLTRGECSCGRTLVKMAKPMGRSDDMLIIRGVNVFPSQIEQVLLSCGFEANYQLVVDRVNFSDTLEVRVELTPAMFSDVVGENEALIRAVSAKLVSMLGVSAKITLVPPKSIARSEGKAVRIIDNRGGKI